MTRSKLSDLEKQEIISLFDQEQETISGLAQRYQVSASTIRRLLKSAVPKATLARPDAPVAADPPLATDARDLPPVPKSKPIPRRPEVKPMAELPESDRESEAPSILRIPPLSAPVNTPPQVRDERDSPRIVRRRSLVHPAAADSLDAASALDEPEPSLLADVPRTKPVLFGESSHHSDEINAIIEEFGHGLAGQLGNSSLVDDDDDDDDNFDALEEDSNDLDELDGLDDLDDADDALAAPAKSLHFQPEVFIEVMPFDQAILPKTCYLVVDRMAELVTRPLKDFAELGQIPEHEIQARTLPVFDNHRVARRFSHRTQRIIKVPNGNMLRSACAHLSAKGITRLLVNGHIYAL